MECRKNVLPSRVELDVLGCFYGAHITKQRRSQALNANSEVSLKPHNCRNQEQCRTNL